MATANLGITLPTVGGSTDTWGGTLNTGITAIDALFSISGTDVTMSDIKFNSIGLQETGAGTDTVKIQAPSAVTQYTLTMPGAVGSSGQVLRTTDGSGTLGWYTHDTTGSPLANTKIWIGSASNVAAEFALSGDATMSAGGAVTVVAAPAGTLSGTTLKSTVVTSSLTAVGALNSGSISSGFAAIDIGSSALTAGAGSFTTISGSTSLVLASGATVTGIDNGSLGTSATLLATQGAIKTYVDAQVTAADLDIITSSGNIDIDLDSESLTLTGGTGLASSATGTTVTFAIDATVATLSGSQTLTNKTIAGGSNTLSAIANGSLSNSTVAYGGVTLALGASDLTPAFNLSDATAYTGDSALVTTGTITSGTWQGTTVAVNKGGTGLASYAAGDIVYASGATTLAKLAKGSDTEVLTLASGVPTWAAPTVGDITAVTAGTGMTGGGSSGDVTLNVIGTADKITVSADALTIASTYVGQTSITTLGTIATGTWEGTTVAVNQGGTGLASYTAGDVIYASGTTTLAKLAKGSDTEVLTLASGVPTWAAPTVGDITGVTAGTGLSGGGTSGTVTLNVEASQTQITSVGALGAGSISSGFGAIDVGSSSIDGGTITGTFVGNVTGNASGSSGSCTGNSATATLATTVTAADEGSDATCFPAFVTGATGAQGIKTDSVLTYNSTNGTLGATTFVGALTGNASGSSGSTTGNAATSTALATARTIGGTSFDGTANIAVGLAATATVLATNRDINGESFDGSASITVTAAAGTLTGGTLNSGVTASSITSVGTLSALTVTGALVANDDVKIAATKKLYFDGGSDTYIQGEVVGNQLDFVTSGVLALRMDGNGNVSISNGTLDVSGASTLTGAVTASSTITVADDVTMASTKQLFLDGGNDTYLREQSADDFHIVVGDTEKLRLVGNSIILQGLVGGTTGSAANMYASPTNGSLSRSTSSLRYKTDIVDYELERAQSLIAALEPISYRHKEESHHHLGFIAEAVHPHEPLLVVLNEDGEPEALEYDRLAVPLTAVVQGQMAEIAALTDRIAALEASASDGV